MKFFSITDVVNEITFGRYANIETGLVAAITELRKNGFQSVTCHFEPYKCVVKTQNGDTELFVIQPAGAADRRSNGVTEHADKPKTKQLRFPGKPPEDGWYKATQEEVQTPEMTELLRDLDAGEFGIVLVDNCKKPLYCVWLPKLKEALAAKLNNLRANEGVVVAGFARQWIVQNRNAVYATASPGEDVAAMYLVQRSVVKGSAAAAALGKRYIERAE